MVTVLAVAAGPFGTMAAMPEWWTRAGYWAGIAAVSVGFGVAAYAMHIRATNVPQHLSIAAGITVLITGLVHTVNLIIFPEWNDWSDAAYLLVIVALIVAFVHLVLWWVPKPSAPPLAQPPPLLAKLPIQLRAPLIRLEAQDHYTRVVTTQGNALVLIRLSDAIAATGGTDGAQVHRSHWVAFDHIEESRTGRSGPILRMQDGADIPVSRTFRPILCERGLFGG